MLKTLRLFCVFLAAASLGAAKEDAAARPDIELIQGQWRIVSNEKDGQQGGDPKEDLAAVRFTFKGNTLLIKEEKQEHEATFTLDPAAKLKHLDVLMKGETKKVLGIYRLAGDSLTICMVENGQRPTDFTTAKGSGRELRCCSALEAAWTRSSRSGRPLPPIPTTPWPTAAWRRLWPTAGSLMRPWRMRGRRSCRSRIMQRRTEQMGLILAKKGRLEEAIEFLHREALKIKPDYAEAREHLTQALKTEP